MKLTISNELVSYNQATEWFEIPAAEDEIWILEHENVYTCGKSVNLDEKFSGKINGVQALKTNRGGLWTYHGKGQVVVYFKYNLRAHNMTLTDFLNVIEKAVLEVVSGKIDCEKYELFADHDKRGFWIRYKNEPNKNPDKWGFIGLHVSRGWLTHGISINYTTDLSFYDYIVPCGLEGVKITSIEKMVSENSRKNLDIQQFKREIGEKLVSALS